MIQKYTQFTIPQLGEVTLLPIWKESEHHYQAILQTREGTFVSCGRILFYNEASQLGDKSVSQQKDYEVFKTFRKSKKQKIVFIDLIEVISWARNCGVGTAILQQFLSIMKSEGVEMVVLKAYPLTMIRFGMSEDKTRHEITKEKERLHQFYIKNGFEFAVKNKNYMIRDLN